MAGEGDLSILARRIAQKREGQQAALAADKAKFDAQNALKMGLETRFISSDDSISASAGEVGALVMSSKSGGIQASSAAAGSAVPPDAASASHTLPGPSGVGTKRPPAMLSFGRGDDEEDEGEWGRGTAGPARGLALDRGIGTGNGCADVAEQTDAHSQLKRARLGKDPTVHTAFLRDADAGKKDAALAAQLEKEWIERQEQIKMEPLEVTYSYWDGTGHRRSLTVQKGTSVGRFLELARQDMASAASGQFAELRSVSSDSLLFIKEDLILPHSTTFYTLQATKARGKSGPLFHFDVHDDVRLLGDARVEKDEAHPGKIVRRSWYNSNKHVFPASRWEIYDPTVSRDDGYTVHGREVR